MTIREHISTLRFIINKHEDDTDYTDAQLYSLLISAAAIMNKRKDERKNKLSDWKFNYYTIGMQKASPIGTDCLEIECEQWITKFQIPTPLSGRNRELIQVCLLDGTPIDRGSKNTSAKNLDPILENSVTYNVINQYIVLHGRKPKAILIGGIWEDVTDWAGIQLCDEEGQSTKTQCYSLDNDEFPVDTEYNLMMYDEVLKRLGIRLQQGEVQTILTNQNYNS